MISSSEFLVEAQKRGKYGHESFIHHELCILAMTKYCSLMKKEATFIVRVFCVCILYTGFSGIYACIFCV